MIQADTTPQSTVSPSPPFQVEHKPPSCCQSNCPSLPAMLLLCPSSSYTILPQKASMTFGRQKHIYILTLLKIYWWLITAGSCKSKVLILTNETPHDPKPISLTHLIFYTCSHWALCSPVRAPALAFPTAWGESRRATPPGYLGLSLNVSFSSGHPTLLFSQHMSIDNIFLFSTAYPSLAIANMCARHYSKGFTYISYLLVLITIF